MIFLKPALSTFFHEKIKLPRMDSNFTCMFQMMIPINSVSYVKFGKL